MNKTLTSALIAGGMMCFNLFSTAYTTLRIGDKAPEFSLINETGKTVTLSNISGKVALVFFPKAHRLSFGCKKQVCSIRNSFADLKEYGITTFGLADSKQKNLLSFVTDNHLPFSLLHATDKVMEAYGVVRQGITGAFNLLGAERYTFLIDNGIIVAIITDVDTENHAQQIIDGFKAAV